MTFLTSETAHPAPAICVSDTLALQIDAFVMVVTESLCLFENSSRVMEDGANRERKARILAGLGSLEQMACALREASAPSGGLALAAGVDGGRRENDEAGRAA